MRTHQPRLIWGKFALPAFLSNFLDKMHIPLCHSIGRKTAREGAGEEVYGRDPLLCFLNIPWYIHMHYYWCDCHIWQNLCEKGSMSGKWSIIELLPLLKNTSETEGGQGRRFDYSPHQHVLHCPCQHMAVRIHWAD